MSSAATSMRPAQDPQVVRQAKEQDWYIEFDDINPVARDILEKYSGIAPADVVSHVKDIRERAINIFIYPCIGMIKFLDIEINKVSCYDEIKQRITAGEKYLEVGCCFGQELRKLIIDGVPQENLYASDLDLSFAQLGYDLFNDKDRLTTPFIAADILAPQSDLDRLQGQISIISASLFFHLFSWDQQLTIGKRLVSLLAKDRMGLFVGGHVAGDEWEQKDWLNQDLYVHSEASWKKLWDEIGAATNTKWEVTSYEDRIVPVAMLESGKRYYVMRFVVRQV